MCSSAGCKLIYNGSFPFGRGSWILCCDANTRSQRRKRWLGCGVERRKSISRLKVGGRLLASNQMRRLPTDPNAIEAAEARPTAAGTSRPNSPAPKPVAETEAEDSYTSRLLKAKKQVWQDRSQDRGFDPDAKDKK